MDAHRIVSIVAFSETPVAALEHRGPADTIAESIRRFVAWRRRAGLPHPVHATFNIIHPGAPGENFDLCVATAAPIAPNADGIVAKVIPAGRCAVLRHTGPEDGLSAAIAWLYCEWLPSSSVTLRAAPLFFQRVQFAPFVAANEAVLDIFLPLN